jgi:hypothetical protein
MARMAWWMPSRLWRVLRGAVRRFICVKACSTRVAHRCVNGAVLVLPGSRFNAAAAPLLFPGPPVRHGGLPVALEAAASHDVRAPDRPGPHPNHRGGAVVAVARHRRPTATTNQVPTPTTTRMSTGKQ